MDDCGDRPLLRSPNHRKALQEDAADVHAGRGEPCLRRLDSEGRKERMARASRYVARGERCELLTNFRQI